MRKLITIAFIAIATSAFAQPQISLTTLATGFDSPVDIQNAGDERLFIVEQDGTIKIVDTLGNVNGTDFLDISSLVKTKSNEQGLLGLAFHPDYATNGYFFVHYTDSDEDQQVSRFTVSAGDRDIADANTELKIINFSQRDRYHNGGCIQFGPDGYLYIGTGDGSGNVGGDPDGNGQDSTTLLAAMLRLDIDNGSPYSSPADNPFVGNPDGADEIWATGLRNPWRFSFDKETGDLWIADVGQEDREEINMQLASSAGGENYGWNCREASLLFSWGGECPSDQSVFTEPAFTYSSKNNTNECSITGGYVYRGSQFPGLTGHYIYTDYCSGEISSLYDDNGTWTRLYHGDFDTYKYSSFGEDAGGEMYVAGVNDGKIYKITDLLVGIESNESNQSVGLSPNPFSNTTTLEFDNASGASYTLRITSTLGVEVKRIENITGSSVTIDRAGISNGVYFYSLKNGNDIQTSGKLIIE
ncbi:MAG: PQQ-dependent sugar dehydrogenase [Flavobacteriales bacterium]|nr:PQQ-dependent sugar dehydrogenase [Flavobacteriales bacterium]